MSKSQTLLNGDRIPQISFTDCKPDYNWFTDNHNRLLGEIISFKPEIGCNLDPILVEGVYPFTWNKGLLKTKPLVDLIFIKNYLSNSTT